MLALPDSEKAANQPVAKEQGSPTPTSQAHVPEAIQDASSGTPCWFVRLERFSDMDKTDLFSIRTVSGSTG